MTGLKRGRPARVQIPERRGAGAEEPARIEAGTEPAIAAEATTQRTVDRGWGCCDGELIRAERRSRRAIEAERGNGRSIEAERVAINGRAERLRCLVGAERADPDGLRQAGDAVEAAQGLRARAEAADVQTTEAEGRWCRRCLLRRRSELVRPQGLSGEVGTTRRRIVAREARKRLLAVEARVGANTPLNPPARVLKPPKP